MQSFERVKNSNSYVIRLAKCLKWEKKQRRNAKKMYGIQISRNHLDEIPNSHHLFEEHNEILCFQITKCTRDECINNTKYDSNNKIKWFEISTILMEMESPGIRIKMQSSN